MRRRDEAIALHVKHGTSGARSVTLTIAFYRGMARFVVAHPAVVPNAAQRALVLAGIAGVGTVATLRAAARSLQNALPPKARDHPVGGFVRLAPRRVNLEVGMLRGLVR